MCFLHTVSPDGSFGMVRLLTGRFKATGLERVMKKLHVPYELWKLQQQPAVKGRDKDPTS